MELTVQSIELLIGANAPEPNPEFNLRNSANFVAQGIPDALMSFTIQSAPFGHLKAFMDII